MDSRQLGAMGGGLLGFGLGSMFSDWQNPAKAGMPYLNQIGSTISPYYNPYINAGNNALSHMQNQSNLLMSGEPGLQNQYTNLMNNPSQMYNQLASNYQQSPGYQFSLKQALNASNNAAAAGGMAGSPQAMQQNMQVASGLASQDFNNYLQNALGMYNTGLQGEQGLYNLGLGEQNNLSQLGFGAASGLSDNLAQALAAQSQLAYQGANAENEHDQGGLGAFLGGLGTLGGLMKF